MSIADELGVDFDTVLYLKTPPDEATLRGIIAKLEDPVTDLVRRDSLWTKLGLTDADVQTEDQVVAVLLKHKQLHAAPGCRDQEEGDHRPAEGSGAPAVERLAASSDAAASAADRLQHQQQQDRTERGDAQRPQAELVDALVSAGFINAPPINAPSTPTAMV